MGATRKFVEVSISGHVARVLLNRPPVNALNRDCVAELTEAARGLSKNSDIWVIALKAAGRVFCAGADLKERAALDESRVATAARNIQKMARAWIEIAQPVLAGVQGAALGGGLELALAADILVASDAATLGLPEVSLGIIPAAAGTQRLSQRTTLGVANKWVLKGSKTFITHGSVGSTFVVMAVTGKAKLKSDVSAFIVERSFPGFSAGKKENKLGMRASDTAALLLDGVRVPSANLLGKEGEGFKQALRVLDSGRIGIAALAVGLAQGALDASIKYAKERRQFGRALSEFQGTRWKLADMATGISAARLLTRHAAFLRMQGREISQAAAQAKYFASEVAARAASEAVQIHGGYGFIKDFPVEKLYRDVKLLTIGEGTSEVQKMIIAKNLLK